MRWFVWQRATGRGNNLASLPHADGEQRRGAQLTLQTQRHSSAGADSSAARRNKSANRAKAVKDLMDPQMRRNRRGETSAPPRNPKRISSSFLRSDGINLLARASCSLISPPSLLSLIHRHSQPIPRNSNVAGRNIRRTLVPKPQRTHAPLCHLPRGAVHRGPMVVTRAVPSP